MSKKNIFLLMSAFFAMNVVAAERTVAVSSAELNVIKAETDVLGRHNSKVRNTPQAYVKGVKKSVNQNFLAKASDYSDDFNEIKIDSTWGVFEYKTDNKGATKTKYVLNGKTLEKAEYLKQIEKIEDADKVRNLHIDNKTRDCPNSDIDENYSVNVIPDVCSGKDICEEKKDYTDGKFDIIKYWNYTSIVKKSNLYTNAVKPGYVGRNIGISFTETGLPLNSFFPANRYVRLSSSYSSAYNVPHGTNVARVLNHVASKATLYGYQNSQHKGSPCENRKVFIPDNGYRMNPKIYIGSHSYGQPDGGNVSKYKEESKVIDDFIYNTRTIEFASMGNSGLIDGAQSSAIAMGVNVISVGAVHNDLTYHQTSSWRNPVYPTNNSVSGSGKAFVKPEIANFADFLFPSDKAYSIERANVHMKEPYKIDLTFSFTSAATPYTAASVALLLDRYPFYRWHPEVVKALLITSSILPITDAKQHDKDNESYAMGVPEGSAMFKYNRSRFWNGNKENFFDSNKEIQFKETDIDSTKTYRIAIAWLSSGSYVYKYGRLPQDINLEVRQDGKTLGSSASVSNPFEFVEIKPKTSHELTIIIKRKNNYYGRVLLGYNLLEVH